MIMKVIQALGSWTALIVMAFIAIGWATWNRVRHQHQDGLDLVISIWTMLLDVVVIIAANHTQQRDGKTLREIVRQLEEMNEERRQKPKS